MHEPLQNFDVTFWTRLANSTICRPFVSPSCHAEALVAKLQDSYTPISFPEEGYGAVTDVSSNTGANCSLCVTALCAPATADQRRRYHGSGKRDESSYCNPTSPSREYSFLRREQFALETCNRVDRCGRCRSRTYRGLRRPLAKLSHLRYVYAAGGRMLRCPVSSGIRKGDTAWRYPQNVLQ